MSLIDDYRLLEIPTHASAHEAKTAFRRLARLYHPDKNPGIDTTEHFQRLQAAYQNVLDAIKTNTPNTNWKPYQFTQASATHAPRYAHYSSSSDKEQAAFIKERQQAYEEMKRNSAQQEKTRNEAIKNARNTFNEKRVKALYEEAFKASKGFSSKGFHSEEHKERQPEDAAPFTQFDIPPYDNFVDEPAPSAHYSVKKPIRLHAAKAAFRTVTYLACFAAGIYATLYWQDSAQSNSPESHTTPYISGLYPQYRSGINYTLVNTKLFAEPDTNTKQLISIPALVDLQGIKEQGDWLTVRYQGISGWVQAQDIGFGSAQNALETGCIGQPGIAPRHGQLMGSATGHSRLRILNQLQQTSILQFQSYDGLPPFSIYLRAGQAYAANFIPRGRYRLVLETGSLYHQACNQFLFNDTNQVVLNDVEFASTEQSLTLRN
ncbi:J domain-containing protein [Marinomonas pollencensis]|uniref:DnaJ-like protein n=1 Tax=Marinomonas pollencensis TaxID=491954 RepID=A0A3E0DRT3_9GAMM|nr:J domain-containing protein [Marinomonas pollencensis]REG85840.1 DnaJ-like protein [Marinomonas pollencensis]